MDNWLKEVRGRFSNTGHREEPSSSERRITLQKTQSFKGEKKKPQNWLRRQFSRQMSREYETTTEMEQAAAVAAAAYAIKSLQEPEIKDEKSASGGPRPLLSKLWSKKEDAAISMPEQKQTSEGPERFLTRLESKKEDVPISTPEQAKTSEGLERSFTRLKSRKEDTSISITEPGRASKRFSGEDAARSPGSPGSQEHVTAGIDEKTPEKTVSPPMKKTLTFADEHLESPDTTKPKRIASKVIDPSRSMRKTPSFAEELSKDKHGSRDEGAMEETDLPPTKHEAKTSTSDIPPTIKPAAPSPETRRQTSARSRTDETEADAWETAEMAKIQQRYDKLSETILTWENKKKKKARTKLDRTERSLERRRLRALQKFRNEIDSIDQIAGGARAQALERRKNEELKAKEKANIIRTTGKVPATCFCF